jgi:hypothetical protein
MHIRTQRVAGEPSAVYVEIDRTYSVRTSTGSAADLRTAAEDEEKRAARMLARAKVYRAAAEQLEKV